MAIMRVVLELWSVDQEMAFLKSRKVNNARIKLTSFVTYEIN